MHIRITEHLQPESRSGVYAGGIGSGGFEVRPDGRFHSRQLFNEWRKPEIFDAQFFHHNGTDLRVLSAVDMAPTGERIAGVKDIEFTGEFPRATLRYPTRNVEVTFTSIFIPGDLKNSSLPVVLMRVKGEGRLLFLASSPFKSYPLLSSNAVVLKSDEGGLGALSQHGTLSGFAKGERWPAVLSLYGHEKFPPTVKPDNARECYLGIEWNGTFDDEVILAWHFPTSLDHDGKDMGHYYTHCLHSCEDVLAYVARHKTKLLDATMAFHASVYRSSMPEVLAESYGAQLSAFVKQSRLARDGTFGVWEGSCCCCGLQTTDVAYYGSWIYASLFPELERSALRLTTRYQRKADGWIPHNFNGTFDKIDTYGRKDMNMQFILLAYRDYYLWKDEEFLSEIYPAVKRALKGAAAWDTDGDAIPEVEAKAQTFDDWGFTGCSIYLATLWLGALTAASAMARQLGDVKREKEWSSLIPRVRQSIVNKLWNGEYFILAVDKDSRDEGCLLDALAGDWFCRLVGLGGILDDAMVSSHLKACLRLNRTKMDLTRMYRYGTPGEAGFCYINAGYPDNRRVCYQQWEPWTGMEYTFAIHLQLMGMPAESLQVVTDVLERKVACGMVWNHIECGGDYFRPMVIGALWDLIGHAPHAAATEHRRLVNERVK